MELCRKTNELKASHVRTSKWPLWSSTFLSCPGDYLELVFFFEWFQHLYLVYRLTVRSFPAGSVIFHIPLHNIVSCKTRNHSQTSWTIHKPSKRPTNQQNHPKTSKTTQKPAKHRTNPPLISQKISSFFSWKHLLRQQHFPCPSCPRREMGAFFWCSS